MVRIVFSNFGKNSHFLFLFWVIELINFQIRAVMYSWVLVTFYLLFLLKIRDCMSNMLGEFICIIFFSSLALISHM